MPAPSGPTHGTPGARPRKLGASRDAMPPLPPDIRLPSIDGLRAFEAVAQLGSFERAAEVLHITASAVSKRVSTLEELLGLELLARQGRQVALTPAGREYLPQASQALALLAAMPQHRRRAQRRTRLRVCTPPTFARQVLVPALESFTRAEPDVDLEVVLSIPHLAGPGEPADVEVRNGDAAALGGEILLHDRVLPLAAPALLARLPAMREPADLAHAPLLRTPLEPWTPWFAAAGLDWPEPDAGPRLVDLGLTLEAAVTGQGVALARPSLARHWLAGGQLVAPFALLATPAHQYVLLPPRPAPRGEAGDEAAATRLRDWLAGVCRTVQREAEAALAESLSGRG